MLVLISTVIGSGACAFLGWFLNYCKVEYNAPFGPWIIFFYVAAAVVVVAGVIDTIVTSVRRRVRRRRISGATFDFNFDMTPQKRSGTKKRKR